MDIVADMDILARMMHNSSDPIPQIHHFSATTLFPPAPPPATFINPRICSTDVNSMGSMREMIFRMAVMQPVHIDPESVKAPKRRNVKISKDPQSVAARHRRERISEKMRILQRLVPGGSKMDTASMLDEAIHYVKFLKKQVQSLEQLGNMKGSCQPQVWSHMLTGAMQQQVRPRTML